jgi:hypothetical protein
MVEKLKCVCNNRAFALTHFEEVEVRSRSGIAGLAGIGFAVLTFVGLLVANPPGGTYSASDSTKYLARGHHVAVFLSVYLLVLAVVGLVALVAYLRSVLAPSFGELFTWLGLASAILLAAGWGIVLGDAIAHAYGGRHVVVPPTTTYLLSEIGAAVIWGPAAILLGFALVALAVGTQGTLPGWLRIATVIGAIGGILGPAFFPSILVLIWALVLGIWLVLKGRRTEVATTTPAIG